MPVFRRDLVVAGASAGGVEALRLLAASLPADFPAAILVTMHLSPGVHSALPQILDRAGPLPARSAVHGAPVTPGVIHVSPPDRHLLVDDGVLVLTKGPTENGHRPAINATFRSAAVSAGPRTVGVILSGSLDDGALGLRSIVDRGGAAMVQDPADALYAGMPESALAKVVTEHVLPIGEIGPALDKLVRTPWEPFPVAPATPSLLLEDRIAHDAVRLGATALASGYTCPDCQGTLMELAAESGPHGHYRCRIGHAWSAEALLGAQDAEFQRALGTALRSLDEKAALAGRLQGESVRRSPLLVERYGNTARECASAADTLRRFLISLAPGGDPGP